MVSLGAAIGNANSKVNDAVASNPGASIIARTKIEYTEDFATGTAVTSESTEIIVISNGSPGGTIFVPPTLPESTDEQEVEQQEQAKSEAEREEVNLELLRALAQQRGIALEEQWSSVEDLESASFEVSLIDEMAEKLAQVSEVLIRQQEQLDLIAEVQERYPDVTIPKLLMTADFLVPTSLRTVTQSIQALRQEAKEGVSLDVSLGESLSQEQKLETIKAVLAEAQGLPMSQQLAESNRERLADILKEKLVAEQGQEQGVLQPTAEQLGVEQFQDQRIQEAQGSVQELDDLLIDFSTVEIRSASLSTDQRKALQESFGERLDHDVTESLDTILTKLVSELDADEVLEEDAFVQSSLQSSVEDVLSTLNEEEADVSSSFDYLEGLDADLAAEIEKQMFEPDVSLESHLQELEAEVQGLKDDPAGALIEESLIAGDLSNVDAATESGAEVVEDAVRVEPAATLADSNEEVAVENSNVTLQVTDSVAADSAMAMNEQEVAVAVARIKRTVRQYLAENAELDLAV